MNPRGSVRLTCLKKDWIEMLNPQKPSKLLNKMVFKMAGIFWMSFFWAPVVSNKENKDLLDLVILAAAELVIPGVWEETHSTFILPDEYADVFAWCQSYWGSNHLECKRRPGASCTKICMDFLLKQGVCLNLENSVQQKACVWII